MKNIFDIFGKRILITGGARGIGFSLAKMLAEHGARIFIADVLDDLGSSSVKEIQGENHLYFHLDITNEASVQNLINDIAHLHGGVDIALNCAGIAVFSPAFEMSYADFSKTLEINLNGAFLLSKYLALYMTKNNVAGKIIHLASVSSYVANPNYAAYSSSKAGLSQLVKVLAREWADKNITVNAIGPAITPTLLTKEIFKDKNWETKSLSQIPMGRFGTPEDLLGAVLLLASSAGGYITGQTLFVDGGRTLV